MCKKYVLYSNLCSNFVFVPRFDADTYIKTIGQFVLWYVTTTNIVPFSWCPIARFCSMSNAIPNPSGSFNCAPHGILYCWYTQSFPVWLTGQVPNEGCDLWQGKKGHRSSKTMILWQDQLQESSCCSVWHVPCEVLWCVTGPAVVYPEKSQNIQSF